MSDETQDGLWAIFDGTGSYRIGNTVLKPGATFVRDPWVIQRLRRLNLPWVTLSETREIPPPEADEPVPIVPIPYDKFQGRDDKWYFHYPAGEGETVEQSVPFDTEEEVDAAIIAARDEASEPPKVPTAEEVAAEKEAPLAGQLTAEDVKQTSWACRGEGCTHKPFGTETQRTNHERINHPELFGGDPRPAGPPPPPPPPPAPTTPPPPASDNVADDSAGVPNPDPSASEAVPVA